MGHCDNTVDSDSDRHTFSIPRWPAAVLREASIRVVELETTVHHSTDQLELWSERCFA